jgi:hypothetical protein
MGMCGEGDMLSEIVGGKKMAKGGRVGRAIKVDVEVT